MMVAIRPRTAPAEMTLMSAASAGVASSAARTAIARVRIIASSLPLPLTTPSPREERGEGADRSWGEGIDQNAADAARQSLHELVGGEAVELGECVLGVEQLGL